MKKVLFATTALVASAGFASADISISGFAEMGVSGGDAYASSDLQFHNDIGINVDMSGETDNGLTFGAHMELDDTNGNGAINGYWQADNETAFISGAFGTLTLGETDGAFDKRLSEVALAGGTITDDETAHAGYNGNSGLDGSQDNQILRYDYAFGDFGFSASFEQDNNGAGSDDIWGLGVSYGADMGGIGLGLGLGYQTNSINDVIGVSATADFGNGFEAAVNYSDLDGVLVGGTAMDSHVGVGVAYSMDALTFAANWGQYDHVGAGSTDGYGMLVNYALGGGATIQAGYGDGDNDSSYSLGLSLSF